MSNYRREEERREQKGERREERKNSKASGGWGALYCASLSLLCDAVQALPKQTTEEWRVRRTAEVEIKGDDSMDRWRYMGGEIEPCWCRVRTVSSR